MVSSVKLTPLCTQEEINVVHLMCHYSIPIIELKVQWQTSHHFVVVQKHHYMTLSPTLIRRYVVLSFLFLKFLLDKGPFSKPGWIHCCLCSFVAWAQWSLEPFLVARTEHRTWTLACEASIIPLCQSSPVCCPFFWFRTVQTNCNLTGVTEKAYPPAKCILGYVLAQ